MGNNLFALTRFSAALGNETPESAGVPRDTYYRYRKDVGVLARPLQKMIVNRPDLAAELCRSIADAAGLTIRIAD